jgi:prepilin-type N-terminal cleavage/methylation domain-containing protein
MRHVGHLGPRACRPRGRGSGAGRNRRRGPTGRLGRGGKAAPGSGFTLVELLIVVSIIALLVTMLVPSLRMALELARRATCAVNLNGIAKGLVVYEVTYKSYPYVPLNGAGWGVEIGTSREAAPAGGVATDRSPSSCLYLLVKENFCPRAMFVCPSAREETDPEMGSYWDFEDGKAVSYALMNPYGPNRYFDGSALAQTPILADSSPYFDPATGLRNDEPVVDLTDAEDREAFEKGNSLNHARDGQNVTAINGSTIWQKRADVGCGRDNIYSRAEEDDGADPHGSIPDPADDGSGEDQGPAGPKDSYLVQ